MKTKTTKPKKENKQVVEIHVYIHQVPIQPIQQTPWNPPYTFTSGGTMTFTN